MESLPCGGGVIVGWLGNSGFAQNDYSAGFAKFYKLGLPDVTDAQYVAVELHLTPGTMISSSHYEYRLNEAGVKGNAWLLGSDDQKPPEFIYNQARRLRIHDIRKATGDVRQKLYQKPSAEYWGAWEAVDLERDIKKTIEFLEELSAKDKREIPYTGNELCGRLFIAAIHYHSQGYEKQANRIVKLLFELQGDQRKVILAGFNLLADAQYADAYAAFQMRKSSWSDYGDAAAGDC